MIFIFNPEHDMALANFQPHYTAPASARIMTRDLELLPFWYAPENSFTAINRYADEDSIPEIDQDLVTEHIRRVNEIFGFRQKAVKWQKLFQYPDHAIMPWGWNPMLRKALNDVDIRSEVTMSLKAMKILRNYSNRCNAVKVLQSLKPLSSLFCGDSWFIKSEAELVARLLKRKSNCLLKEPLSGSGKGLIWIFDGITDKQLDRCRRVIDLQGGIVMETICDKIADFAMEFQKDEQGIRFVGYSLFKTTSAGAYVANHLMSDAAIEQYLSQHVQPDLLHLLRERLLTLLPKTFPQYKGVLGVDMMVCITPEGFRIHPCVEINMRMNMGFVARIFHDRYVAPDSNGIFKIDYFKKNGETLAFHQNYSEKYPLRIEKGRIKEGYLALTPVTDCTRYISYVHLDFQ